jgi:hypothetical protein
MAATKPAPASDAAPASPKIATADVAKMIADAVAKTAAPPPAEQVIPWFIPTWPVVLGVGLYAMSFWVLYILAPAKHEGPSELFKTLASAVIITAFINGVVAAVYTAARDSQKKNDTIAAQARAIAAQSPTAP